VCLYSALFVVSHTQGLNHAVLPAITPMPVFTS